MADGLQSGALAFGGESPPNVAITEDWNGASWSEVADLNVARRFSGASGSASSPTSALCFGGDAPGDDNKTEEWSGSSILNNVLTD